jgi:hypothetical protein
MEIEIERGIEIPIPHAGKMTPINKSILHTMKIMNVGESFFVQKKYPTACVFVSTHGRKLLRKFTVQRENTGLEGEGVRIWRTE